jgi:3-oxoacyl-[acyl-carrier protein] reductase
MKQLAQQNIFITGAASGIGKATAILLAAHGARLFLIDKNKPNLAKVKKAIRKSTDYLCDVSKEEQVKDTIKQILKKFKTIDVLINNAGILDYGKIHKQSSEKWVQVINTNLIGIFFCTKHVLPNMIKRRKGHIINLSSVYGKNASADSSAYCASKFGIRGLSQSLAQETERYNIKVTTVHPSTTKTNLFKGTPFKPTRNALKSEDIAKAIYELLTSRSMAVVSDIDVVPLHDPYK